MSTGTLKVLVVDDDPHIGELLTLHLEESGFTVKHITDGQRGLEAGLSNIYDLIILDVMLPGKSGIDICRELRTAEVSSPIMMLTFRGDEVDKVLGLELGADDYVTKPFSVREVVARAKALTRRKSHGPEVSTAPVLAIHNLTLDPNSREVTRNGEPLELTSTEFDLLLFLGKHQGRAFTREHLLHAVWGYTSSAYEHTVNTHINRLRSKIEVDAANPTIIQTVWGVGYKCRGERDASSNDENQRAS